MTPEPPPSPAQPPAPRRRGAQPHNTNALKHGLYARPCPALPTSILYSPANPTPQLPNSPAPQLPNSPSTLQSEIDSLRAHMLRLDAIMRLETAPEKFALYFRILCEGHNTLSRMLRIQRFLVPPGAGELEQQLLEAFRAISAEIDPIEPPNEP